ncbi:HNH endonuclease [Frateuria sp. GZRR33]|uniref:HNH endonuclease n=1 Tax=Frateuria sp. GZRR33 TaxID=3351535 RepID=UPI003EDC6C9D
MAGWIKLRDDFDSAGGLFRISQSLGITYAEAFYKAVSVASWFARHGKQGKLETESCVIDCYVECPGFAEAMKQAGYLREHGGVLTLHGYCTVSATRKGLGKKIRAEILSGASCAACGATGGLVIDHIIPVVRGGTCERTNLQALCAPCNMAKGRKTMDEFMAARGAA